MTKYKINNKGFSLVEIIVIVAIMIVLLAILTPSLLKYVENSRVQKDDSAMDELCHGVMLALSDSEIFDEAVSYSIPNNYVTYTDSSGVYAAKYTDEEFWAPDGSGHAVTITFNPSEDGEYILADGLVNDMTYGNGSVADGRTADDLKQCYFSEMGQQKLYHKVEQTIGTTFSEKSSTYQNSSYTVFITFDVVNGIKRADVYGEWNGTNLDDSCPASLGSGTSSYIEEEPEQTKAGGTTQSNFTSSDLQGSGSTSGNPDDIPSYKKDNLPCGHKPSVEGNHDKLPCNHYACRCTCQPAPCGIEGHTTGDGKDHSKKSCGHYACSCGGTIPSGGTYYIGVKGDQYLFSYDERRTGGDCFPAECKNGDAYTYGDYEYRYNQYASYQANEYSSPYWYYNYEFDGWGCDTSQNSKTSYTSPLAEVNGKPLVSAGGAWSACKKMVTPPAIPDSVWYLNYAFDDCTKLTTAPQLPPHTKSLNGMFQDCTALRTYVGSTSPNGDFSNYKIPDDTESMLNMFLCCRSLTHAPKIPGNVTTIWQAFSYCSSMVQAPDLTQAHSLVDMDYAFRHCTSLTTPPNIPSTVTLMREAFLGCTALETPPVIPEGVSSLKSTFKNCTSLRTAPRIPANATYLEEAFSGCTALTGTIVVDAGPKRAHDNSHMSVFSNVDFQSQQIRLTGSSTVIDEIGKSGRNYCALCNGLHQYLHIETSHYHANNQNYVVLGTWDYRDAKSVNIVVEYHLEGVSWDWVSITEGLDYVAGQSYSDTRKYLSTNGSVVTTTGTNNNVKFVSSSYTMTKTFSNVNMLTGSVVFRSDSSTTKWGARVTVIPNY